MNAADVMTPRVVSIGPDATVAEVAQLLLDHRISALPVVDGEGRLIGIVSEGDLMRRTETGTERHRSWWLRAFGDTATLAADYVKSHALRVRDVMTAEVLSVTPDTGLTEVANLLEKRRIKRVPVVRDGRPVGIISRSNLLQALVAAKPSRSVVVADDRKIRERLLADLARQPWWNDSIFTNIVVSDGVVHVWGLVDADSERKALRIAAERVPGVRRVEDHRTHTPVTLV